MKRCTRRAGVVMLLLLWAGWAGAAPFTAQSIVDCQAVPRVAIDKPAQLILDARRRDSLPVSRADAAKRMDRILREGYGATLKIEPAASGVRATIADIAELAMNNQVIAAQVLSAVAMRDPQYVALPLARPLDMMIQSATEPYEGDSELFDIRVAHSRERAKLGAAYVTSPYVRLALLASAFDDSIALDAAVVGLCNTTALSHLDRVRIVASVNRVRP
jgi:hypothetical protein